MGNSNNSNDGSNKSDKLIYKSGSAKSGSAKSGSKLDFSNQVKSNKPNKLNQKPGSINSLEKKIKNNNTLGLTNTPYKLGVQPAPMDKFEETLKKKTDEIKIKKEEKKRKELDEIASDEKNEKNENNLIYEQDNIDNKTMLGNKKNNKKTIKKANNNLVADTVNNLVNMDGVHIDYKNHHKNNIPDDIPNDKMINQDFIDVHDDVEDENIRKPIPSFTEKLINDEPDDFEKFKQQIMSDDSIDPSMKQVIIQSRKEFIDNQENKTRTNAEKVIRVGLTAPLIVKIKSQQNLIFGKKILEQIDRWVDGKIQLIKLDSEPLFMIYEFIDELVNQKKIIESNKLKNIFAPQNPDEYVEYLDMMEVIKTQSIREEEERIKRENEKKEMNERNDKEIRLRETKLSVLNFNLNKLGSIDKEIYELKKQLTEPIGRFISLQTNLIELDLETGEKLIKFLNSIRIKKEDKDMIISLYKIV